MLFAVIIAFVGQAGIPSNVISKDLDPYLRPRIELAPFKKLKCVSVSEFIRTDEKSKKRVRTLVYRFSYKADFDAEVRRWKSLFSESAGWKQDKAVPPGQIVLDRNIKHKDVRRQALLLVRGRLHFDNDSRAKSRVTKETGWVWVSYNEDMIKP